MRLLRIFGGFTLLQIVGFAAPFVALPIIARIAGPVGWVHIASAQALGSLAAVVIIFGWWTAGPGELYQLTTESQRIALYRRSVLGRLVVSAGACPLLLVGVYASTPPTWIFISAAVAVAAALPGLSPAWLFVARAEPAKLAVYEVGPRAIATIVSIFWMQASGALIVYPSLIILATLLGYAAAWFIETPQTHESSTSLAAVLGDLRSHAPIAMSNVMGSIYSQSMVPIAAVLAPASAVSGFVSADKLYRASRFTIDATANTLQSWTLRSDTRRNHLRAVIAHAALGILGGLCISLLTPFATERLFGAAFAASYMTSTSLGVAFLCTSLSTPLVRNILIPRGRKYVALTAAISALVVGLTSVYPLYVWLGAEGFAVTMALSEAAGLCVNAWAVRELLLRDSPSSTIHVS